VGKVEAGIPEDDPRNPATIADNVGDNVGDVAGMGADLYESYCGSILATAALGAAAFIHSGDTLMQFKAVIAPMLIAAVGILLSIIGIFSVRTKENAKMKDLLNSLAFGTNLSSILIVVATFFILWLLKLDNWLWISCSVIVGLIVGIIIGRSTEYYTSQSYRPTQKLSESGKTDNGKDDEKTPNSFDFSTTSSIQVNVKYDVPEGYKVLFEIYLEDPFTIDKDGQIIKRTDLEPVIRRMTDGNGAYSGKEIINSDHGDEAYIYTSYIGVPTLFKTVIAGDAITADIKWDSTDDNPQTRAEGWQAPKGYHVLGTWSSKGYPHYLDTDNKITIPGDVLTIINTTLKEGGTCPKQYRQAIDFEINDPEGRNAEVSIRIIGGTSGAASAFGYYCYRADASLSEIKKAPKCIVFPNTLMDNYYNKKASGLQGGESVKLHYIDPDGVDQGTVFPNGVKIGWFLLNDSFYGGNNKPFYSTTKLNGDGRTHTAAFRIDDFVVLSFEDWTDQDYNDIQFNVWSNPIEAIINPDIPDIKPDGGNEDKKYSLEYKGIIAFEDNWPRKGDYDLNDVIVKYQSVLNFNDANQVLSTEDTYELLWSGATFKNGFAYQLNTERSNMSTEILEAPTTFNGQGLDTDLSKATVNVFLSALDVTERNTKTATYKIKNTFKTPLSHETLGIPPYNPFIMVHDELKESRIEVHLVNYPPTEKADMALFHTEEDLSSVPTSYYVANGNYPFAIHLSGATNFNTPETHPIDKSFEHFMDWVNSNGTDYKDWYK
jgi:LruC domain-containing protein